MAIRDNASFGLIRTNPKISGNVKITTDSSGSVWLNTINATRELSSDEFKRYRTTRTSTYAADLRRFVGSVQPDSLFFVREFADPESVSRNLAEQYDFFYSAGVSPLISDAYSEEYSYFAPLWLGEQIPEYFVIFKIDDPMDFPYNLNVESGNLQSGTDYKLVGDDDFSISYGFNTFSNGDIFTASSIPDYNVIDGEGKIVSLDESKDLPIDYPGLFEKVVREGQIIKTFDMSPDSELGSYIRRIRDDRRFPASPITVRFEEGLLTTWNGISYQTGSMTSKGERLDKFWSEATTQIDFEEYITRGFERQGIVCPFMLNLEFLFNDTTADNYDIPRYFGFYVKRNVIGNFQLSGDKLFDNRNVSGNTPAPKRPNKGFKDQSEDFFQNNPDGVRIFFENANGLIPDSTFFDETNFEHRFFAVQDRDENLYSVDQRGLLDFNLQESDIVLRNSSVNLGKFSGAYDVVSTGPGRLLTENGRSYMAIRVIDELLPNDTIRIYWNIGLQQDAIGFYDEITANDLRRPFTISTGGTTVSLVGDLTAVYNVGDSISIAYPPKNRVSKNIITPPVFDSINNETTFDIDSPINPTATEGFIEIAPGWGPGSYLASQSLDPVYYHPYGSPSQIAAAIAGAFNSLPQRNFDAIVDGDTCVLRMRSGMAESNNFFCTFSVLQPDRLEVQGLDLSIDPTAEYNFRGGTDLSRIRVRVPLDVAQKLSEPGTYLKTKLGISAVSSVDRYVDEAFMSKGSSVIDRLSGFSDFAVVTIDNFLDTPSTGSTNEYVAYNLFKVPVCLLSIFSIKDVDGDFWSSDYNRSPVHEFRRYFNLPGDSPVLVPGRTYYVLGDDSSYSITHNNVQYNVGDSFVANTDSFSVLDGDPFVVAKIFFTQSFSEADTLTDGTYEVLGDQTDQITVTFELTAPDTFNPGDTFTIDNFTGTATFSKDGTNAVVVRQTPSSSWISGADSNLISFPGFSKFKDFLTIEEETEDKNTVAFKLRDKYFFNDIDSEYDYLKENYNKDLAAKSRLVQWISKWVYQGGSDVRDNPYRLNVHPAFGVQNFSPSFDIKIQDPEAFTHEWYYLEGRPHGYLPDWDDSNYYFFNNKLDIQSLVSSNGSTDYFADYFNYQPTPNSDLQKRYSVFSYNSDIGVSETLFRGVKIRVREIVRDSRPLEQRGVLPPFKENSTRFDGYRFSSILRIKKETPFKVESPVEIEVLENVEQKTITMVTTVIIEDYRTLELSDINLLGSEASPQIVYPETLDAAIDYTLLYSLKSKRLESRYLDQGDLFVKGVDSTEISDIKLSFSITLASPSIILGQNSIVSVLDNPDYDWDVRDEVKSFGPVNTFYGQFQFGDTFFQSAISATQTQIRFPLPFPSAPFPSPTFEAPVGSPISIPTGSQFEWNNFATYQREGGRLYLEPILQRISFGSIAEKINSYSKYVKYKTYRQTVLDTTEVDNEFYLEMIRPSKIEIKSSFIPVPDEDKPEELSETPVIGTELVRVNSASIFNRYGGPYAPKFRDILFYQDQNSDQISDIDLSFAQATINPNVSGFGLIRGFGYLKVSNSEILALSQNDAYPSLYPLIDEYAIDKKDFPVYLSSWDPGFWRTFVNTTTYRQVAGSRVMSEVKNFLASKIMKTPQSISLQTFMVQEVDDFDSLNINDLPSELVFSAITGENTDEIVKVVGYVNVRERLLRFLLEDGADREFLRFLMPEFGVGNPETLEDDVLNYLTINILPTYEIKIANSFENRFNDDSLPLVEGGLNDVQKVQAGYRPAGELDLDKVDDFVYKFEFSTDGTSDVSLAISVLVGKI